MYKLRGAKSMQGGKPKIVSYFYFSSCLLFSESSSSTILNCVRVSVVSTRTGQQQHLWKKECASYEISIHYYNKITVHIEVRCKQLVPSKPRKLRALRFYFIYIFGIHCAPKTYSHHNNNRKWPSLDHLWMYVCTYISQTKLASQLKKSTTAVVHFLFTLERTNYILRPFKEAKPTRYSIKTYIFMHFQALMNDHAVVGYISWKLRFLRVWLIYI